jgi:hypothetical protein
MKRAQGARHNSCHLYVQTAEFKLRQQGCRAHCNILVQHHSTTLLEVRWLNKVVTVHNHEDILPGHLRGLRHEGIDLLQDDVIEIG